MTLLRFFLRIILLLSIATNLFAEEEKRSETLIRQPGQNQLQTQLSIDIYRSVPYESEYTVEVPYEVDEAYTDYEEYYDQEWQCHTKYERECGVESVCRTEYEQKCGYENVCHTEHERVCRDERICKRGPEKCENVEECGAGRNGERKCKTRRVCHSEPETCENREICKVVPKQKCENQHQCRNVPREVCHNERRCHNVPREKCGYEQVVKTRPVTKYRKVTKYRTETRCCETRYRDVFDHQEQFNVTLQFPREAILFQGESETVKVEVASLENKPIFRVTVDESIGESIYNYKIKNTKKSGANVILELTLAFKYSQSELGKNTLENARIEWRSEQVFAVLQDSGRKARVQTAYSIQVREKNTEEVLFKNPNFSETEIELPPLDTLKDYIIQVGVARSGIVLEKPIQFEKAFESSFERLDPTVYKNPEMIKNVKMAGNKTDSLLIFSDLVPWPLSLKTDYKIELFRMGGFLWIQKKKMAEKLITIKNAQDASEIKLSLLKDFGISEKQLNSYCDKGDKVIVQITAIRQSIQLEQGNPIKIEKEINLKVE